MKAKPITPPLLIQLPIIALFVLGLVGCGGGSEEDNTQHDYATIDSSNEEKLALAATEGFKQTIIGSKVRIGCAPPEKHSVTSILSGINSSVDIVITCEKNYGGFYNNLITEFRFESNGWGVDGRFYNVWGRWDSDHGDDVSGYHSSGWVGDPDFGWIEFWAGPVFFNCNNGHPSSGGLHFQSGKPQITTIVTYNDCSSFTVSYNGTSSTYLYKNVNPLDVPRGVSLDKTTNESAVISWNSAFGVASYNIYFAQSPGVTKTNYSRLPNGNKITGVTSPQTITVQPNGNPYFFVVTAQNEWGETTESNELVAHIGPMLSFDVKTIRFTWADDPNATHYKLFENPDGISGFSQIGGDIPQGTESFDHIVPLYKRINANYILQSCIGVDCTDYGVFYIVNMVDAIGYIKASFADAGDHFGWSVSLSGDGNTLAVGAPYEDSSTIGVNTVPDDLATDAGAVYVFGFDGVGWTQQAYIKASNLSFSYNRNFGSSVSLSDDGSTLAVGAPDDDGNTSGVNTTPNGIAPAAGAVYLFSRDGSDWTHQAYIKASNTGSRDNFGTSVSLSGDGNTLAVGAPYEDSSNIGVNTVPDDFATDAGAVYVFGFDGHNWSQQAYIKSSNTGSRNYFGASVSLSDNGDILAVSSGIDVANDKYAYYATPVYVFSRSSGDWSQQAQITTSNTGMLDTTPASVSLSGDGNTLAIGEPYEDSGTSGINTIPDNFSTDAGAVYVYVFDGIDWTQQAYIKASYSSIFYNFGKSVSLSDDGNTLLVSAIQDSSDTSGINTIPDYSGAGVGAAYVFIRSYDNWSQRAYIKASNPDAYDYFGSSISLSDDGNTLAIGATGEGSSTTGINTMPDDLAPGAGAVYLY